MAKRRARKAHSRRSVKRTVKRTKRVVKKVLKAVKKAKEKLPRVPSTPVTKYLMEHGVAFNPLPHSRAAYTSEEIARERHRSASTIVKCIVLTDGENSCIACVPGDRKVKAGLVRDVLGTGKLQFAGETLLRKLTGMPAGTTAPIGIRENLPVVVDKKLAEKGKVSISSGNPKFGLELSVSELIKLSAAKVAAISE